MILIFDTETTGYALADRPPDDPGQPHLVELGAILADADGTVRAKASLVVKPDGYAIPKAAADVHGVTTEIALRIGLPRAVVVAVFLNMRALADEVVAHNFLFDEKIMDAAIFRTGRTPSKPWPTKKTCTVELAAPVVNLPPTERMLAAGFDKPKAPKLGECIRFFFDEELAGAHSALADAEGCARVFFELKRRGAVSCPQ